MSISLLYFQVQHYKGKHWVMLCFKRFCPLHYVVNSQMYALEWCVWRMLSSSFVTMWTLSLSLSQCSWCWRGILSANNKGGIIPYVALWITMINIKLTGSHYTGAWILSLLIIFIMPMNEISLKGTITNRLSWSATSSISSQ